MKARLAFFWLMPALLPGLVACSSLEPKEVSVDIASSGKEVALATGDTLIVTLESNFTPGYSRKVLVEK